MSASAQALRLHILMAPLDLGAVYDRLRVLNLTPHCLLLRCASATVAFLVLDLLTIEDQQAEHLINRLRQMPTIRRVRSRRYLGMTMIKFGGMR